MHTEVLTRLLTLTRTQGFFTLLHIRHNCFWMDSQTLLSADAMMPWAETKKIALGLPQKHSSMRQ